MKKLFAILGVVMMLLITSSINTTTVTAGPGGNGAKMATAEVMDVNHQTHEITFRDKNTNAVFIWGHPGATVKIWIGDDIIYIYVITPKGMEIINIHKRGN